MMLTHHISALPVVGSAGELIGIVSEAISSGARRSGPNENRAAGCSFSSAPAKPRLTSCTRMAARLEKS
jgi:CBS-domain-containing membrane protein